MKKTFNSHLLALLIFFVPFLILPSGVASQEGVTWYGFEEGLALGKEKAKKVFISFTADWCGYCKAMDRETFMEPGVVAYLNENFIPVKIDSDKEKKTTKIFKIRGLPDTWFMSETGDVIGHRAGFIPPDTFIKVLKYIHTDSYKSMTFAEFLESK